MFNSPFVFAGVSLIAVALLVLANGCFGAGFSPVCVRKPRSYKFAAQGGLDARWPARPTIWIGTLFKPTIHVLDGAGNALLRLAGVLALEGPLQQTVGEVSDPFGAGPETQPLADRSSLLDGLTPIGAPPHDEEPSVSEGACGS